VKRRLRDGRSAPVRLIPPFPKHAPPCRDQGYFRFSALDFSSFATLFSDRIRSENSDWHRDDCAKLPG
jgi:hypothetical protein